MSDPIKVAINEQQIIKMLQRLAQVTNNLRPLMVNISEIMYDDVMENFQQQGQPRWQAIFNRLPMQSDVDGLYRKFIPRQLEVLANYAALILGVLEVQSFFRKAGMKIGSNTGYNRQMTDLLLGLAKKQGYQPDATVCATEFPTGRPAPWMAFALAQQLNIFTLWKRCSK